MKRLLAITAPTFILLLGVLGSSRLFAAKPPLSVAAVATFSDRGDFGGITDNIYSDGAGVYSDGTIGGGTFSEVSIGTGAYGDFLLRLDRSPRFLTFDYSDRLTGSGLTNVVNDYNVYFKIYNITTIPCGQV